MGGYEDLVEQSVETVLWDSRPRRLAEIQRLVRGTLGAHRLLAVRVSAALRSHPERFVEVAPGVWVRRNDGPNAGVPSAPPRAPLAGGTAAAAIPPAPWTSVDAVATPPLTAS